MSDVGEVAGAVHSIADLLRPLVETAIVEKYERQRINYGNAISNAFLGTPDDMWAVACRLLNDCNHPATPSGGNGALIGIPREMLFNLLQVAADSIRDRNYMVKYIEASSKK